MKSLEELRAIREKMKRQMDLRGPNEDHIRVVVGMATCGIAAGARPVMAAFLDEVEKRGLKTSPFPRPAASVCAGWSPLWKCLSPVRRRSPT